MLIQLVSANPALLQSVRDEAERIAETAITESTWAIAKPPVRSASEPSCTITSDKYNYWLGEIIVFMDDDECGICPVRPGYVRER